jgi:hypothetical protein
VLTFSSNEYLSSICGDVITVGSQWGRLLLTNRQIIIITKIDPNPLQVKVVQIENVKIGLVSNNLGDLNSLEIYARQLDVDIIVTQNGLDLLIEKVHLCRMSIMGGFTSILVVRRESI